MSHGISLIQAAGVDYFIEKTMLFCKKYNDANQYRNAHNNQSIVGRMFFLKDAFCVFHESIMAVID